MGAFHVHSAESVFPAPHFGEYVHGSGQQVTCMAFGRSADRGFAAAQERVDEALASKCGRQRNFVALATLLDVAQGVADVAVVGFDGGGEPEV
jgi:hypothetical protein